jgi:hypothetical protein
MLPVGGLYFVSLTNIKLTCRASMVYTRLESLRICDVADNREKFAPLRILSFDIECDIKSSDQMPDARHEAILQIGNMVSILGIYSLIWYH